MSAPDISILLAYESHIEPAWAKILAASDLAAFVEFSDYDKATPFVDVMLDQVVPTGHRMPLPDGSVFWDAWTGQLVSRVVTQRGKNSARQAPMLGAIRVAAQNYRTLFTREILPWHAVDNLKESGLVRGIDEKQNLDWSEQRYQITFNIRTDIWAA